MDQMTKLLFVLAMTACNGTKNVEQTTPTNTTMETTPTTKPGTLSKDEHVFVAVFLHEIAAGAVAAGEAVCLAMRSPPGDGSAILAAVRASVPTAVLDKECTGGGPTGPVKLVANGGAAARFDIGPISWVDENTAFISGGGAHRGGHAREVRYTVTKVGGAWKVTNEKLMLQM
jgi:hypothetical protein